MLALFLSNCNKPTEEPEEEEPAAPIVNTDTASYVSQTWATLNGLIKAGNLLTTISFEYDTDTNQVPFRYTISASPDTLTGNTTTRRTANITGLTPETTYYYRPKAVNSLGETYGPMRLFTTLEVEPSDIVFKTDLTYGEISDIEGNVYKTIQVGAQIWMAQNLAVTKYNDGEQIPLIIVGSEWQDTLLADAYSWYDNIEAKYGALYNWHAVSSDKLCPTGWRVPTDNDWTTLTDYLGGEQIAGGKLKETGAIHWMAPNVGASNSSGFTALPGGYRSYTGSDYYYFYGGNYNGAKRNGYWWTSSSNPLNHDAIGRSLNYSYADINKTSLDKRTGAYVRCIKE